MKINVILTEIRNCGGTRILFQYCDYLVRKGHNVVVYYPLTGYYTGLRRILWPKAVIKNIRLRNKKLDWFVPDFQIIPVFNVSNSTVRRADVTIATYWVSSFWLDKLSPSKGKKVYFIQGLEKIYRRGIEKKVVGTYHFKFDSFITVSSELREKLLLDGCDARVVLNSIPECEIPSMFIRHEKNNELLRVGLPYREDDEVKNCKMGIDVLGELYDEHLIEVSSYGFRRPDNWRKEWSFVENPSRKELYSFYETIDVLYVPSVHEGWGLPAMEAMAHGRVVIMGNFGILSEVGVDEVNCVKLANPKDKNEAKDAIRHLSFDRRLIFSISQNAYNTIQEIGSNERSAEQFEQILLNL